MIYDTKSSAFLVLTDRANQNDVFNETCKNLLEATMADRNCCLFTYGASGSGKTYTIMGSAGETAGLLPRSLESIFSTLGDKLYKKQVLFGFWSKIREILKVL